MKNIMEDIVKERLAVLLKDMDCCKCERCVEDMQARALNAMKPRYTNTSAGELYSRANILNLQNLIDIDVEISKAIDIVEKHPNH